MKKYKIMYFSLALPDLLKEKQLKTTDTKIGGAAIQWYSWLIGFTKLGEKVGILTYKGAKNYIGAKTEFDIIESFDINKGIPKLRILYYIIPILIKTLKKNETDFLFCAAGSVYTGYLGIVTKFLKTKYVVRIASDADVDTRMKTVLNNSKSDVFFSNLGLKLANIILAQNQYQASILRGKYPKKNIQIIHNPFFIKKKKEFDPLKIKDNYIAWVGNFRAVKNLPALLKITESLPEISFKIAGVNFKNSDNNTQQAVEKLRKKSNVEFMGYLNRKELLKFIAGAKALLNTSILEGFSNTFLEAWSYGTPVISTSNVNPDEIITKHNLGFIGNDYKDLPQIITDFSNISNEDYSILTKRCIHYVNEFHDPQQLASRAIEIIENN